MHKIYVTCDIDCELLVLLYCFVTLIKNDNCKEYRVDLSKLITVFKKLNFRLYCC